MIIKFTKSLNFRLFKNMIFPFSNGKIVKSPGQQIQAEVIKINGKQVITDIPESELIDMKQNVTSVPGSQQDRQFASLSQLQRDIVQNKKFDLLDKRIKLQQTGISDIMSQNLTKVDLGEVSIKSKNQILLSDIDPNNIPQDMDIIFSSKKKLTLVGKRIKKGSENQKNSSVMKVSDSSFEQKSLAEFRGQAFNVGSMKMVFNRVQFLRVTILFLPIIFLLYPFLKSGQELNAVRKSILQIEEQQAQLIKKTKKYYYRKTLLNNPEFLNIQ